MYILRSRAHAARSALAPSRNVEVEVQQICGMLRGRVETQKRVRSYERGLKPNSRFCQPPASHTHTHTRAHGFAGVCIYLPLARALSL